MRLIIEILARVKIVLGAVILALIGRDRFYLLSQDSGLLASICRTFSKHPYVVKQVLGWQEIDNDINCERRSDASLKIYQGDSLSGWADADRKQGDGHVPLNQQMRSIVIPSIVQYLEKNTGKTILEIGTGNGDVIADLAMCFPEHRFIGVDLSVRIAKERHTGISNLVFKDGYALEMLERFELKGDAVFASSTFVVFTPKELCSYMAALKNAGYSYIVLADPLTRRFSAGGDGSSYSRHMAKGMWGHNYAGYFKQFGFNAAFKAVEYRHHNKRNKITFQLVSGER